MPARALIVGGFAAGARFVAPAWRGAWAAMILAGAAIGAFLDAAAWGAGPAWLAAWLALALLTATVAQGALYRLALAPRPDPSKSPPMSAGPGGLQWGRVETRLLAVWLLSAVFLFILGLLVFVALLACAYAVASAGAGFVAADPATWAPAVDERGRWVLGLAGTLGAAALIWASLRLRLAPAASIAGPRVRVLSAWPLTRGLAAPILAATLLIALPPAALLAVLALLSEAKGSPMIIDGAINFAKGMAVAGLCLPMNAGLMTYLFERADAAAP